MWNHYIDYLVGATQRNMESIKKSCDQMKSCIADGCMTEVLKEMMLSEFEPNFGYIHGVNIENNVRKMYKDQKKGS